MNPHHSTCRGTANAVPLLHLKARTEKPPEYPDRYPVPDELVAWEREYPDYRPPYYTSPVVLANDSTRNPAGWADPEDFSNLPELPCESLAGTLLRDRAGRPVNPAGRTGIAGRGLLGKWGPNYAADPIITRINLQTGSIELLAVQRKDNDQWAIPGGMVDKGEEVSRTLVRELLEETGVTLDMEKGRVVYRGYVDDPRNTDHAWMETTAKHLHLPSDIADRMTLSAGDDARSVRWLRLVPQTVRSLYASHCALITTALKGMTSGNPFSLTDQDQELVNSLLHTLEEEPSTRK
jgi:ADP-ribose pyrophosphatase